MSERVTPEEKHIEVRELTVAYGDFVIQRDLSFAVRRGDIFIIMGGSGCGKSTLLRCMVGLKMPAQGSILYESESFWDASPEEREQRMHRFGVLFQAGALWSSMTLAENIEIPLREYTRLRPAEIRDRASLMLSLVGLAGFEAFMPAEISGGNAKARGTGPGHGPRPRHPFLR